MSRTFLIAACAVVLSMSSTLGFAQNQQQFPWRAQQTGTSTQSQQNQLPPIVSPGQAPTPPQMQRQPMFASSTRILQQDQAQPQQPSLSDVQNYDFNQQQAAPNADGTAQDAYAGNDVPLAVQSNALPDIDYGIKPGCNLGCPKRLIGQVGHAEVGGWAQFGYHNNLTGLFNDRPDEFNLHQFWIYASKKACKNDGFGYRLDAAYGIDGRKIQAFGNGPIGAPDGWDNDWDFGEYGWAIPQAYVELFTNGTTIRAGRFLSPFGVEKIPSIENFFYSRTYTRNFIEPYTHTGVVAERQVNSRTSFLVGATAGWDSAFTNVSHGANALVGFQSQLNENVTVYGRSSYGDTGYRDTGYLNSFVANLKLLPKVNYIFQFDNLNLKQIEEFGVVQYLFVKKSDCFGVGARLEWWKSNQFTPSSNSTWDLTLGANWRPHANFMIRPELRMDWGANAVDPGDGLFGIDGIILF